MSQSVLPVAVDDVTKSFRVPRERVHTLKERALHPLRRTSYDVFHALRGVSFAVEPGEFFGIVGRNGSGKSTLLKCLAGIYATDAGTIHVDGRMSTFIELGVGFNPDLAARDNVMVNATMLGLSQREARRRFDRIVEFAELEDFVDLKLKNYSSGMMVRLAFAVMIQVDADILLIDEVLAVGDAAFQQKCFDEFARIRDSGTSVLFVTHDMSAVRRFCDRAMLLEQGHIVEIGDPERVGNRYLDLNFSREAREAEAAAHDDTGAPAPPPPPPVPEAPEAQEVRTGDGTGHIIEGWFENARGERVGHLHIGEPCTYVTRVVFSERVRDPLFGLEVLDDRGVKIMGANNVHMGGAGWFEAGDEIAYRIRFDAIFAPGRHYVTPSVAHSGTMLRWIDRRERMHSFVMVGTTTGDWVAMLPYELDVERAGARTEAVR